MTDLATIHQDMMHFSASINESLDELRTRAVESAELDASLKRHWSAAFLCAEGTVRERECHADQETADRHQRALIARALEKSATEAVRSRRQQLSAMQTLASAHKAEAEFVRTAPAGLHIGGA